MKWFEEKKIPFQKDYVKQRILIKKRIISKKTFFQKIEVFDSFQYGRILVLDGVIQTTEKDEFFYHEMIVHLPLFYHGKAENVLIIGGGDGGALEEVLKHPIKEVWLCEIDEEVIKISRKYLHSISKDAFEDKRVKIAIEDGWGFVKKFRNYFDVIIVDSTDPLGPSKKLYSQKFYEYVARALRKGIVIVQSGNAYFQFEELKRVKENIEKVFQFVKVHLTETPSYGIYSFVLGSKKNLFKISLRELKKRYEKLKIDTQYYNPEIHIASGILPNFLKLKLKI